MTAAWPVRGLFSRVNAHGRSFPLRSFHVCMQSRPLFRSPIGNIFNTPARSFSSGERHQAILPEGLSSPTSFASPQLLRGSRVVRTLDESRLSPSDFHDISGSVTPRFHVLSDDDTYRRARIQYFTYRDKKGGYGNYGQFPADVRGFLYFHRASNSVSLAHEIRFRKTGSADPTSFKAGQDLLLPNGLPWRIPVFALPSAVSYEGLYRLLIRDGLVSANDVVGSPTGAHASGVRQARITTTRSAILFSLDQPLSIRYGRDTYFWVMTSDREASALGGVLTHQATRMLERYTGALVCRFERSTLPEHEGTRTVVLRILEITEDVKLVNKRDHDAPFAKPVVGELLPRLSKLDRRRGVSRPWSCNVDDGLKRLAPLRLLVDAAEQKK